MRAAGVNHKEPLGVAHHPDPPFLELGIHSVSEVGRISNAEHRLGLEQSSGKEEPQEHEEIDSQEPRNQGLHRAAAALGGIDRLASPEEIQDPR